MHRPSASASKALRILAVAVLALQILHVFTLPGSSAGERMRWLYNHTLGLILPIDVGGRASTLGNTLDIERDGRPALLSYTYNLHERAEGAWAPTRFRVFQRLTVTVTGGDQGELAPTQADRALALADIASTGRPCDVALLQTDAITHTRPLRSGLFTNITTALAACITLAAFLPRRAHARATTHTVHAA